jgi:hypothetical protein
MKFGYIIVANYSFEALTAQGSLDFIRSLTRGVSDPKKRSREAKLA